MSMVTNTLEHKYTVITKVARMFSPKVGTANETGT